MGFIGDIGSKIATQLRQDANFSRAGKGIAKGARGFGPGAVRYLVAKVPIVQWLPNYSPHWLVADLIAGQSVGLILVPQALMFSALAGIPMAEGLLASWLPGVIYAIMGTSKDLSTGPTSSIAMMTGTFVLSITKLAPAFPPSLVAAVISFSVGLWSLLLGILNLGFIFDFISFPIALGFVTGISYVVITAQIPSILGEVGIGPAFAQQGLQIITKLPTVKPITIGLSVASLAVLFGLRFVGSKWGSKNELIRIVSNSRNSIVLGTFTLISYIFNKDLETPLWAIIGPTSISILTPQMPSTLLLQGLLLPSATVFAAVAMEHVLLARFMVHKNGYTVNPSQELVYLGVTNMANSFFGAQPVSGGDLARASINSESGVKSPLSGIITSSIVVASMFAASDFIEFIPQPTLAAVIILATFDTMPPMINMGMYWKLSFLDFITFLLSFKAPGQDTVGRTMFSWPKSIMRSDLKHQFLSKSNNEWANSERLIIPPETQVVGIEAELNYLNASRMRRHIIDTAYTYNSGKPASLTKNPNRSWDYRREKHVAALRRKASLGNADTYSPRLRILVLDFSNVSYIDSSGIQAIQEIKTELREYGGEDVDFRFVGLTSWARRRFERASWPMVDLRDAPNNAPLAGVVEVPEEVRDKKETAEVTEPEVVKDLVFELLPMAVVYQNKARRFVASYRYDEAELSMQKQ